MVRRKRPISPSRTGPQAASTKAARAPPFQYSTVPFFRHSIRGRGTAACREAVARNKPNSAEPSVRNKTNSQGRDCFPRLRGGRLAALLAMTGRGERPLCETNPIRRRGSQRTGGGCAKQSQFPRSWPGNVGRAGKRNPICRRRAHSLCPTFHHSTIPSAAAAQPRAEGGRAKQSQFAEFGPRIA